MKGVMIAGVIVLISVAALWTLRDVARAAADASAATRPYVGVVPMPADSAEFALQRVSIPNAGGAISAWYGAPKGGATVILCTGTGAIRTGLWEDARVLLRAGHGVVLFDWPGHGESAGPVSYGRPAQDALKAVVDAVEHFNGVDPNRIGIYAFSFGGVTTTALLANDRRIGAVVLAGTPVDMVKQTRYQFGRTGWLAFWISSAYWSWRGESLRSMSIEKLAPQLAPRPVFVIAGDSDRAVPVSDASQLAGLIGASATLWIIPGAGHGRYQVAAADYESRVAQFFTDELKR